MNKWRGPNKMEALAAISTFAIALLTLGLVIFACVNYFKFIENIGLVAQGLENQAKAISLQDKDIVLTHKPVVYIQEVINLAENGNPDLSNYNFIFTNSGKLPARNVDVVAMLSFKSKGIEALSNRIKLLESASIYPNSRFMLNVPNIIKFDGKMDKAEIVFTITYNGDGIEQKLQEKMKYILVNNEWVNVGPQVDIFFIEKFMKNKDDFSELEDLRISEGILGIVKGIVVGVIGVDKVLGLDNEALVMLFSPIPQEVYDMKYFGTLGLNGGALTGLRSNRIIDQDDQLTEIGVSVFKCVAETIGAE